MSRFPELTLIATLLATPLWAESPGRTATPEEIATWDIDVRPDGMGLPEGSGSVADGDKIFQAQCSVCHGVFGEGTGRWPVLTGGQGSLSDDRPVKTIGSYWPYLSTVYDYINRAMPFGNAQSLEPDQVYAITAYLLYMNDEVGDDFVLSSENFLEARLPNEDGFVMDNRPEVELAQFSKEPCMTDCKPEVKITMHAAVLDVTPEETAAKSAEAAAKPITEGETAAEPAAEQEATAAPATEETPAEAPAPVQAAIDPEMVKAGEKVFRKCKACHQVGDGAKNRVGPILNGVVDAPAGAVEDFKYSKALKTAADEGLVWSEEALGEFLRDPKGFLKGTKMSFGGLRKDSDVAEVIAYLRATAE